METWAAIKISYNWNCPMKYFLASGQNYIFLGLRLILIMCTVNLPEAQ